MVWLILFCLFCDLFCFFFFSSRRRHTRFDCDWSSDVCSSDLREAGPRHRGLGREAGGDSPVPSGCLDPRHRGKVTPRQHRFGQIRGKTVQAQDQDAANTPHEGLVPLGQAGELPAHEPGYSLGGGDGLVPEEHSYADDRREGGRQGHGGVGSEVHHRGNISKFEVDSMASSSACTVGSMVLSRACSPCGPPVRISGSLSMCPVSTATTRSCGAMAPEAACRRTPARLAALAGSQPTPARSIARLASRISSSGTLSTTPRVNRTARTARSQEAGSPILMAVATVRAGTRTRSRNPAANPCAKGAAPSA